jgi:hypothetical protein
VKSGIESLLGTGAKVVDTVQPFTLSEQDAAVLFKDKPEELAEVQPINDDVPHALRARHAAGERGDDGEHQPGRESRVRRSEVRHARLREGAYLSPIKVVGDAIQSLPTTLALAVSVYLTKGVAGRVEAQALEAGMSPELARQAAVHAAAETMAKLGAATEGAAGFGQQAIQTREAAEKISNEKLAAPRPSTSA